MHMCRQPHTYIHESTCIYREKELEERLTTAREEVASVESKYSKLLEEKIADVDQFTKDRLHKVALSSSPTTSPPATFTPTPARPPLCMYVCMYVCVGFL